MKPHTLSQGIKSWPISERPRERMFQKGVEALSDAELVAILLRSGIQGKDATALARELLEQFGGLRGLFSLDAHRLCRIKGLGKAKVATLLANQEILRRQEKEKIAGTSVLRDPEGVLRYVNNSLRDRKREIFKVLFLNKAHRVTGEEDLFEGTVDETQVHPREVVKAALERHATAVIVVHNHPSGRVEPSAEDRAVTAKLEAACETVGVRMLDHLIVGDHDYFSFREHHLLTR